MNVPQSVRISWLVAPLLIATIFHALPASAGSGEVPNWLAERYPTGEPLEVIA